MLNFFKRTKLTVKLLANIQDQCERSHTENFREVDSYRVTMLIGSFWWLVKSLQTCFDQADAYKQDVKLYSGLSQF